jgi:hypothetical protein
MSIEQAQATATPVSPVSRHLVLPPPPDDAAAPEQFVLLPEINLIDTMLLEHRHALLLFTKLTVNLCAVHQCAHPVTPCSHHPFASSPVLLLDWQPTCGCLLAQVAADVWLLAPPGGGCPGQHAHHGASQRRSGSRPAPALPGQRLGAVESRACQVAPTQPSRPCLPAFRSAWVPKALQER